MRLPIDKNRLYSKIRKIHIICELILNADQGIYYTCSKIRLTEKRISANPRPNPTPNPKAQ